MQIVELLTRRRWGQSYVTKGGKGKVPPEEILKDWETLKVTVDEEDIGLGKENLARVSENLPPIEELEEE